MKIYLAGPINGCNDGEATTWREIIKMKLGEDNCIDPMRRDFRGIEGDHTSEIVTGDMADIEECDLVLANCWQKSWGTPMEIFYAASKGKPVVAVLSSGTSVSPWLRYHSSVVFSLSDALTIIKHWTSMEPRL